MGHMLRALPAALIPSLLLSVFASCAKKYRLSCCFLKVNNLFLAWGGMYMLLLLSRRDFPHVLWWLLPSALFGSLLNCYLPREEVLVHAVCGASSSHPPTPTQFYFFYFLTLFSTPVYILYSLNSVPSHKRVHC